ncbi:uncharacterized protein LOC108666562 [Hyalella azteca]|uniref:Uncharacterized protein LOC108666562 n=1 Tax=Hyalella azteca TaxID=294128 RepID=A0A8B7N6Q8_HYAAZ|nr:uncharacterized protein LOC108666562 [Hyalella azteca]
MSATDVVQCARQAASADMAGFSFNGTCTAYKFGEKLCSCSTAEQVIYVTDSSVSYGTPSSVPFSAAPYVNVTVENTEFKQYKLVNVFLDVIENQIIEPNDKLLFDFLYDSFCLTPANIRKVAKYDTLQDRQGDLGITGASEVFLSSATLSWRGYWAMDSARALKVLGLSNGDQLSPSSLSSQSPNLD